MKGVRLLAAGVVAILATTVVAVGTAANRDAEFSFDAFPGPGRVTYGENIAYRATFTNTGGSAFTHVIFRMRVPYVETGSPPFAQATAVSSTCPSTPVVVNTTSGPEWTCTFGKLTPGTAGTPQLVLTVVWKVPDSTATANCDNCLKTNGRWTIKEGVNDPADPNDAFPPGGKPVSATLLAAGNNAAETLAAGGYETGAASCTSPASPGNLRTQPVISLANPVSTKFCLPAFTLPVGSSELGYATTITETSGNARHAEVCIAALGTNCAPGYVDANFSPQLVTHVFQVADAALPKGFKITQVFHNGVLLTPATCTASGECVLSIDLDNKTKIWTIVATAPGNGSWDW